MQFCQRAWDTAIDSQQYFVYCCRKTHVVEIEKVSFKNCQSTKWTYVVLSSEEKALKIAAELGVSNLW